MGVVLDPNAHTSIPKCISLLSDDEGELGVLRGMKMASDVVALVHIDDVCCDVLFIDHAHLVRRKYPNG